MCIYVYGERPMPRGMCAHNRANDWARVKCGAVLDAHCMVVDEGCWESLLQLQQRRASKGVV
jgi:hypothetical protein